MKSYKNARKSLTHIENPKTQMKLLKSMQINDNPLESTIINEMQLNAKDTASFHNKSFGSGWMVAKSA